MSDYIKGPFHFEGGLGDLIFYYMDEGMPRKRMVNAPFQNSPEGLGHARLLERRPGFVSWMVHPITGLPNEQPGPLIELTFEDALNLPIDE